MAIPYITTDVSIDTGFVADQDNNLESFVKNVVQKKSLHKSYKVQNDTLNAISKKISDNGYKPLSESEERKTRLGDIKLVIKYQVDKTDNIATALKLTVTAPTGEEVDVNKAVDVGTGYVQWDVGLGVASEYVFNKYISVGAFACYTAQLAKNGDKRIPEEDDS